MKHTAKRVSTTILFLILMTLAIPRSVFAETFTEDAPVYDNEASDDADPEDTDDAEEEFEYGYKLSEASTRFRANEDRAKNIRNAASKINGTVIMPGQMFSCTRAFGARTSANGYGPGNIISGGTYIKGMGGGICQVSSTLNLAMLRAGVLPAERHNHSHRSSYIASGLDATISGRTLDYKIVNPYDYPLYICAETNGGVITISIYSDHDATDGVIYEPVVKGKKMSNTTHVIGKLDGETVSDRIAYSSRYSR
ncbi:MAG: VanW family protein [Lachnospiraceae bacterium]|nr:VanW family protein [Lachnospiraceae bacterium]